MKRARSKKPKVEKKQSMENESKIERLLKVARVFAYPENMLGIRKENGVEESHQSGSKIPCHQQNFEKCSRFEIFVGKEEMIEIREAIIDLQK